MQRRTGLLYQQKLAESLGSAPNPGLGISALRTAEMTSGERAGARGNPLSRIWDSRWESLPVAMYACDADGRILGFNRRAAALWGRTPAVGTDIDRFCGSHKLFYVDGRPLAHAECPMASVLRTGIPVNGKEAVIERPDGSRVVVAVNVDPVEDEDGRLIGAVNCLHDVTEHKRAQEKLAERERWFRQLLEALPAAIYTTDAEGRITFYNQAAIDLSGRRPELGKDAWCVSWKLYNLDGTPLAHDACPMAVTLKENRTVRGVEAIAERLDGSRITFQPYPTPLRNAQGDLVGAVNMLVDISDRKATEHGLELMASEVDHRAKNILAVVLATIRLTRGDTVASFRSNLQGRIDALARAHALLASNRWQGANLKRLAEEELAPFGLGSDGRVTARGPSVMLHAAAAQSLAMALHELATNAAKYGALSLPEGRLRLLWSDDADKGIVLHWTEIGGPPVQRPERIGVGTNVIERMVRQHGGLAHFDWRPEGLVCDITFPALKPPKAALETATA